MIVMKLGGTSVEDAEAVRRVVGIVGREKWRVERCDSWSWGMGGWDVWSSPSLQGTASRWRAFSSRTTTATAGA
jgi:hypothetical protein